jgi:hypothetical protein
MDKLPGEIKQRGTQQKKPLTPTNRVISFSEVAEETQEHSQSTGKKCKLKSSGSSLKKSKKEPL